MQPQVHGIGSAELRKTTEWQSLSGGEAGVKAKSL